MDEADKADDAIEAAKEAAIAAARKGPFHRLRPTGYCAWCGDPVGSGRLHCRPIDNDCEEVHLKHINFKRGGND